MNMTTMMEFHRLEVKKILLSCLLIFTITKHQGHHHPHIHAFLSTTIPFKTKQPFATKISPSLSLRKNNIDERSNRGKIKFLHSTLSETTESMMYQSYVETIKCQNFMLNASSSTSSNKSDDVSNNNEIVIDLGINGPNLVAVTGETGSGKSLLVFKVFQLVLGDKVSPTIMRGSDFASGEVVLKLSEPHLSFLKQSMDAVGLYSSELLKVENGFAKVSFKRTILQTNTKGVNSRNSNNRFRSKCEINGKQVTLKVLRSIAKPLITIVDASAASSALSQNKARIAIIDTGVPNNILSKVKSTKKVYRDARKKREDIEREIENRVMPASFNAADGDENIELLQHWIDELDDFEKRLSTFQESIASSRNAASLLNSDENNDGDVDFEDDFDINDDYSNGSLLNGPSSFLDTLKGFISCSWEQDKVSLNKGSSVESSFYSNLLDLRDGIKGLDSQLTSAIASCDALSSLSSVSSVASALETSRKYLFDSTIGSEGDSALNRAAEQSHELLNKLEDALSSCATFMSDHPSGLVSTIEKMRGSVSVSVEDIDVLIADWGSLARKHGVSPYSLPPLHNSLRQELDGNVEARLLLPKAKKDESVALDDFVNACKELSEARQSVCLSLTESVTSRLKDLGMTGSTFTSQLKQNAYKCTDSSAYSDSATLGTDSIDFILTHRNSGQTSEDNNQNNMGNLDVIGSSGEKARLLLAIETDLPGSVGASCNSLIMNNDSIEGLDELTIDNPGPVSVIYDEIDAHVGGNAAVSVAKLLSDQTQLRKSGSLKRSQIVSITHSPSLAAIADRHIVVQKLISNDIIESKDSVSVSSVQGVQRLQEISRMASGDLAIEESIQFAEGLLRDSMKYKQDQAERITNVN